MGSKVTLIHKTPNTVIIKTSGVGGGGGAATWGGISGTITNQTDLVNYIDAEIGAIPPPVIPTPPTPTLQSVTDEGNTTTNEIKTDAGFEAYRVGARRVFLGGTSINGQLLLDSGGTWDVNLTGGSNKYFAQGNFGIGTTAPDSKLTVAQSEDDLGLKITGFDDEDNSNLHLFVDRFGNNKIESSEFLQINSGGSSRYRTVGYLRLEVGGVSNQLQLDYNYMKFSSGGTETMRITPGKVGIGTTSPSALLEIASNSTNDFIKLTTTGGGATPVKLIFEKTALEQGVIEFNRNGDFEIYNTDNDGGVLISGSGSANADMYVNHAGNVGIGTTAPSEKLEVAGNIKLINEGVGVNKEIVIAVNGGNETARILYDTNVLGRRWQTGSISADNSYNFSIGTDTNPNYFVINRVNGNVGIGNTAPDEKLRVDGNIKSAGDFIGSAIKLGFAGTANITTYDTNEDLLINPNGSGDILMQTTSGNVGIGTTSPSSTFHVAGTARIHSVSNGAFGTLTLGSINDIVGDVTLFDFKNNGSSWMRIVSGNVGIGTTVPTEKLHVEGNAFIKNNLHVEGDLTIGKIINDTKLVDVGGNFNFDTVAEPNFEISEQFFANVQNAPGNIENGEHSYSIVYKTADGGETGAYSVNYFKTITITDNTIAGQVLLEGIPISSDARVVARDIYRTPANGSIYFGKKLVTINDNTTTTYIDNLSDSALDPDTQMYRKANTTAGIMYIDNNIISQAPSPHRTSYGHNALSRVTIGQDNVAVGGLSLQVLTSGRQNIAMGYASGANNIDGQNNTFLGYASGYYNESGDYNTYVGADAGRNIDVSTNDYNTGVGSKSLERLTTNNSWNTAIGYNSGRGAQGQWNMHLGYYAGYKNTPEALGSFNIHIGAYAGQATTGGNNILIGRQIEAPIPSNDNQLNIGNLIYGTGLGYGTTAATGNVGIGTAAPSRNLHIHADTGSAYLQLTQASTGVTDNDGFQIAMGVAQVNFINRENGNMVFETNNTEKLRITSAGFVGIGTTAPSAKLDVNGDISVPLGSHIRWGTQLGIRKDSNGELNFFAGTNSTNGGFNFRRWDGSAYESGTLVIRNNGNVGIGTTAPAYKLDVDGTFRAGSDSSSNSVTIGIAGNTTINTTSGNTGLTINDSSNGILALKGGSQIYRLLTLGAAQRFEIRDLTNADTTRLAITSAGNVGIGTTAPAVKLDVDGQVHLGPQSSTGFPSIDIASNGRTTIKGSAPALSVRDNNNNGGYIDMGGGTLANINSITSSSTLSLTTTNMRIGGDIGARVNIVGQNSSSQVPLGLKQGAGSNSTMIEIRNSSNVLTMGITSEGGFYFKDSNLVGRFSFDHDYSPSPADGLTVGLDFRTEGANGELASLGYIDVTQDDISADESSMRFSVGETTPAEIMRLQSDGNVGIGTAAPTAKLHIVDATDPTFKIGDASNRNITLRGGTSSRTPNISSYSGLGLGGSDGAFHAFINNAGNVGIGTTAPTEKLHVNGGIKVNGNIQLDGNSRIVKTIDDTDLILGSNDTSRVWVKNDGNVGIGINSPDSKLHVKATSGIAFKVDPNSADKEWYIDTTNPDHLKKEGNLILNADPTNVHASTKISFNIDGSNKASINSDGDLGVGTTAQTSKVHVDGTAMRQLRMGTSGGPSSNTDTSGAIGDMAYDDNYFYIKTINGWGRVALDFGF